MILSPSGTVREFAKKWGNCETIPVNLIDEFYII